MSGGLIPEPEPLTGARAALLPAIQKLWDDGEEMTWDEWENTLLDTLTAAGFVVVRAEGLTHGMCLTESDERPGLWQVER